MKTLWRVCVVAGTLLVVLVVARFGCEYLPESTFQLSEQSRLPKWITLPPGLSRGDVSVTINYFTAPWPADVSVLLQDRNGKRLTKLYGRTKGLEPMHLKSAPAGSGYPSYEIITVNGITEIVEQRAPEPYLYVTDDPAVWQELMGIQPPQHR